MCSTGCATARWSTSFRRMRWAIPGMYSTWPMRRSFAVSRRWSSTTCCPGGARRCPAPAIGAEGSMASKVTTRLALLLAPLVLAGCSDSVMKTIGLQRDPPDEFQVTTQPALAMPPDLNVAAQALPRPDPGASRPQDVAVRQQAEDAMIGGAAIGGGPTTGGDAALVQAGGPAGAARI